MGGKADMAEYDYDSEEESETDPGETADSGPMKQMRSQIRKLEKENKAYNAELEELRTFKNEYTAKEKASQTAAMFAEIGLTDKQANLFLKANPDVEITSEAVKAFALEYGLIELEPGEEAPIEESGGFSPAPVAGRPVGTKRYSSAEWNDLYRENPNAALAIAREGRVDLKTTI